MVFVGGCRSGSVGAASAAMFVNRVFIVGAASAANPAQPDVADRILRILVGGAHPTKPGYLIKMRFKFGEIRRYHLSQPPTTP